MEISNEQQGKIDKIAKKHKLYLVVLHGSAAKGYLRKNSDIDIAVLGEKKIAFQQIIDLNNEFSDVFEQREVDVKSLHDTNPLFRYQVMKDGVFIYGKPKDFYSYKTYAFRDYLDSHDLLRLKRTLIDKRLQELAKI